MNIGDPCRLKFGTNARYIGGGRAIGVSCQDNDILEGEAMPATGGEEDLPLPTDEEVTAWVEKALRKALTP